MEKKLDYRKTLNLPRTDFPMKANLVQKETEILKFWDEMGAYHRLLEARRGSPLFILHDGPPYANGDIHLGTALNKILKDIVVRYKSMSGNLSPFIPGWDCHGQPIEHEVEKLLGVKKRAEISQIELRKRSKEYALKFVKRQAEQFKRLGIWGDWEKPYLTLDFPYEATNVEVFGELYEKGLVYKGRKPIHWCPRDQTALAEAEIEYYDRSSPSIYVKFPLKSAFAPLDKYSHPKYVVIWTTTPWTLPANVAIAVKPGEKYAAVAVGEEIYILASRLVSQVFAELKISDYKVLLEVDGRELESLLCQHPFMPWDSVIILADFVTLDTGTGAVHIAPGHGQEDYLIGLEYNLPAPMPVDDRGVFTEEAGKYKGLPVEEANQVIINDLKEKNYLLGLFEVTHSYPHCWRCKNPVLFRATDQWFISVSDDDLRAKALEAVGEVKWIPDWSKNRITSMLEERPDWCISRQRAWGVPIPVFYCQECGEILVTKESLEAVRQIFLREGADSWFLKEAGEILPASLTCTKCGARSFRKETDILDVWFESGISHLAVLETRPELRWPADLYLEGSDQHRGWFQTSLLTSVGVREVAPYGAVLTHGYVVDGEGRKMSKSLGNVVDPLEVIQKSGADILRLWVASADYTSDIAASPEILERVTEAYRRIRNTARFMLGNLYDFDLANHAVKYEDLEELDRWALLRLARLQEKVSEAFENYRFHTVFHQIYNFCVIDMSALYLDIIKDRLYTWASDSRGRRSSQTALWQILTTFAKILSPILSFTCEEIWRALPGKEEASIHFCGWPQVISVHIDTDLEDRWDQLLKVRGEVSKALEIARNEKVIRNSLETAVTVYAEGDLYRILQQYRELLPTIFIVSQVGVEKLPAPPEAHVGEEISALVSKARGQKCERCWNYRETVGVNPEHPTICHRCLEALGEGT
jgi:isoleucyl-tRNA synthetase